MVLVNLQNKLASRLPCQLSTLADWLNERKERMRLRATPAFDNRVEIGVNAGSVQNLSDCSLSHKTCTLLVYLNLQI
jgi:hypothetical protein